MFGCKVDVALHLVIVGAMLAIRLGLAVVSLTQLDRGEVVGIGPRPLTGNHFPPYTDILYGFNPRGIIDSTGGVEVKRDT